MFEPGDEVVKAWKEVGIGAGEEVVVKSIEGMNGADLVMLGLGIGRFDWQRSYRVDG
jgi:hypothetical protein